MPTGLVACVERVGPIEENKNEENTLGLLGALLRLAGPCRMVWN